MQVQEQRQALGASDARAVLHQHQHHHRASEEPCAALAVQEREPPTEPRWLPWKRQLHCQRSPQTRATAQPQGPAASWARLQPEVIWELLQPTQTNGTNTDR